MLTWGSVQVVRSGPAFALSLVLSSVEPVLRSAAELGAWQIISPVSTAGRVVEVQGLHEVQDMVCSPFPPLFPLLPVPPFLILGSFHLAALGFDVGGGV